MKGSTFDRQWRAAMLRRLGVATLCAWGLDDPERVRLDTARQRLAIRVLPDEHVDPKNPRPGHRGEVLARVWQKDLPLRAAHCVAALAEVGQSGVWRVGVMFDGVTVAWLDLVVPSVQSEPDPEPEVHDHRMDPVTDGSACMPESVRALLGRATA